MNYDHLCHRHDAEIQRKIDKGVWRPSLDTGHVYSTEKHANLNETINNCGYCVIGRKKDKLVSRVIWIAAHGLPEIGMEVDHINGNKTDNRLENLQLITHKENSQKTHHKLTFNDAEQIRQAHTNGTTQASLAREYGVSRQTIRLIIKRQTYKTCPPHEQITIRANNEIANLTFEEIAKIRAEYANGASYRQIAKRWNITPTTVKAIIRGGCLGISCLEYQGGNTKC